LDFLGEHGISNFAGLLHDKTWWNWRFLGR
jgi:hypothetical protein